MSTSTTTIPAPVKLKLSDEAKDVILKTAVFFRTTWDKCTFQMERIRDEAKASGDWKPFEELLERMRVSREGYQLTRKELDACDDPNLLDQFHQMIMR